MPMKRETKRSGTRAERLLNVKDRRHFDTDICFEELQ